MPFFFPLGVAVVVKCELHSTCFPMVYPHESEAFFVLDMLLIEGVIR